MGLAHRVKARAGERVGWFGLGPIWDPPPCLGAGRYARAAKKQAMTSAHVREDAGEGPRRHGGGSYADRSHRLRWLRRRAPSTVHAPARVRNAFAPDWLPVDWLDLAGPAPAGTSSRTSDAQSRRSRRGRAPELSQLRSPRSPLGLACELLEPGLDAIDAKLAAEDALGGVPHARREQHLAEARTEDAPGDEPEAGRRSEDGIGPLAHLFVELLPQVSTDLTQTIELESGATQPRSNRRGTPRLGGCLRRVPPLAPEGAREVRLLLRIVAVRPVHDGSFPGAGRGGGAGQSGALRMCKTDAQREGAFGLSPFVALGARHAVRFTSTAVGDGHGAGDPGRRRTAEPTHPVALRRDRRVQGRRRACRRPARAPAALRDPRRPSGSRGRAGRGGAQSRRRARKPQRSAPAEGQPTQADASRGRACPARGPRPKRGGRAGGVRGRHVAPGSAPGRARGARAQPGRPAQAPGVAGLPTGDDPRERRGAALRAVLDDPQVRLGASTRLASSRFPARAPRDATKTPRCDLRARAAAVPRAHPRDESGRSAWGSPVWRTRLSFDPT